MAAKTKATSKQIKKLAKRLDRLERTLTSSNEKFSKPPKEKCGDHHVHDGQDRFCALPHVPERKFEQDVSQDREELIRYVEKKWVNGTTLHYYFFPTGSFAGVAAEMELVREGFKVWEDVGIGVTFEEVTDIANAEVRIGFLQDGRSWSYVGRDVIDIPGQHERTMNFGWSIQRDPRGVDTPVHEIGHTLGFPHEHQNPFSGIVWDEDAVYRTFGGAPNNWPRATTFHNVLRKLSTSTVEGSEWDPNSIMHYSFPAGLIVEPEAYRNGLEPELGLTEFDIAEVRRFYPPLAPSGFPKLEPFRSEPLSLASAEQRNFSIRPSETREYTMQTFGQSDCVMVLFEDRDGDYVYMAGDDDSGTDTNAKITAWLDSTKNYVLRIRLYLNYASGDTAILLW